MEQQSLKDIVEKHFMPIVRAFTRYERAAQDCSDLQTDEALTEFEAKKQALVDAHRALAEDIHTAGGTEAEAERLFNQRVQEFYDGQPKLNP